MFNVSKIKQNKKLKIFISGLFAISAFGFNQSNIIAQTPQESQSSLYVPLIGITSVPEPLALPEGGGSVTYNYAVKTFLEEVPLSNIQVSDNKCSFVKFLSGDDNSNGRLDYGETWRYSCTTIISVTTQSIATVTGNNNNNNNTATTHKAYTTVVVGSNNPPPLVSIVNITKVAYPLALPLEGGSITFTYKVNNPGVVALSDVIVSDDKCSAMSNKLGDTNANNLLDIDEVWIYTCKMILSETTTNTATVTAFSNGFKAVADTSITIKVETPALPEAGDVVPCFPSSLENSRLPNQIPCLPETGIYSDFKIIMWGILSGVLAGLITFYILARRNIAKIQ